MKKNLFVVMMVMTIAFASCNASKNVAQSTQPSQQQTTYSPAPKLPNEDDEKLAQQKELDRIKYEIEKQKLENELKGVQALGASVDIPCAEYQDDADYFRDFGFASSQNFQSARNGALRTARQMIKDRLGEFVQGFSSSYSNLYAGTQAGDDIQRKMENMMMNVVERMVNDADKICESHKINDRGTNDYYYALQISKKELKEKITDALSADEKLDIDTREAMFQQKMDEYFDKMLEAKKNLGR